jgi:hypothetical protein
MHTPNLQIRRERSCFFVDFVVYKSGNSFQLFGVSSAELAVQS